MAKRVAVVGLVLALVISICLAVCQAPLREWRSMASLRRVDDYPLYVMRYYGDYDLARSLERATARQPGSLTLAEEGTWACTGFTAADPASGPIMGRNFDWRHHQALLLFTDPPDGYASVSLVDTSHLGFPREGPTWADRRVLLRAPYLPFDGMNERGLAVSMMAIPHARDRYDPRRPTIGEIEAIRLLLDHAADVEEAIALLSGYTISFSDPPIHYFVADVSGRAAVIEYVDGEMAVQRNAQPWLVSTNFILAEAALTGADSDCWRYNLAYERLEEGAGVLNASDAMALLEGTAQPNTMWSVVYHMGSGEIDVAMGRQYERVHSFRLK